MIFEKSIDPGTIVHSLQVIRVARGNPLVYRVRCLRPHCGGEFEIDHARLIGLGWDWCQWAGCNEAAKERANRAFQMPHAVPVTREPYEVLGRWRGMNR